jgi:mannosyl-oligosaccharide glucosidase
MPINYLTLKALKYYSRPNSPSETSQQERIRQRCHELHEKLRSNLVGNVLKEYQRTGYFWEQYDDQTGEGIRVHPSKGWTSLFVNILYEVY